MQLVKPLAAFAMAISTGLGLTLEFLSPSVLAQSNEQSAPSAYVESLPAPLPEPQLPESPLPESQLPESPPRVRPQPLPKLGAGERLSSPGRGVLSESDEALLFPAVPESAFEAASDSNAPQPGPVDIGAENGPPANLSPVVPASAAELVANPGEEQDATKPREATTTELPDEALPDIESAPAFPRGAAAIGYRGNATMLVLPGGRIVLAPLGIVPPPMPVDQRPAAFAPPAWSLPPPPPPPQPPPLRFGFRNRLGRR
jgi:hypothetical protein